MIQSLARTIFFVAAATATLLSTSVVHSQEWSPVVTSDGSNLTARHESNSVVYNGMIYLFGGRQDRPVDRYNPTTNVWETIAQSPVEMHHFQPVIFNNKVYIIGAFSCCYPTETTISEIHVFNLENNTWSIEGTMPAERLRGSVGTVVYNDRIYVIGGNTNGHSGGAVPWMDEFNPADGSWRLLPDAPTARDHFSAVVINNQVIASAGRQTANGFANTVAKTDVFDFITEQWHSTAPDIPTKRAGTTAVDYNGAAFIIGGESIHRAHSEIEVFNPTIDRWQTFAEMITPRHAGGAALIGSKLHVFAGSVTRGGGGETSLHEVIDLALAETNELPGYAQPDTDGDGLLDDIEINTYFTDPNLVDTDGDTISDYDEIFSTDTNPLNVDSDADTLNDNDELDLNLNPNNADTDNDGLSDGVEVTDLGSNPLSNDSDGDGLSDQDEYSLHGTNLTSSDTDADGISDSDELTIHLTDPISADTDNDGVDDGDEILTYQSNPTIADTDGDGIPDGQEITDGTSSINTDDDNDGIPNNKDGIGDSDGDGIPNYIDRDSDNDGIPDVVENGLPDVNRDGQVDADSVPTNPNNLIDTDGDGVSDHIDVDSDQDGLPDYLEAYNNYETTYATILNIVDTNQDGLSDQYKDTMLAIPLDTDNDSIPNHLDLDSDDDGLSDLIEAGNRDFDEDGIIDTFLDANKNGLTDAGALWMGKSLPDEDNDNIPDIIDTEFNKTGSSGCSISLPGQTNQDPLFLLTLILAAGGLCSKRKRA